MSRRTDLLSWRQWKDTMWATCPYTSHDPKKCHYTICPCDRKKVDDWMKNNGWYKRGCGIFGLTKLAKLLDR